MTILVSSHILEELYQTASEFILIDKGKIIEEISDRELNDRCKRHIAIKATDPQKALIVLEETLHTDSFKLMPDGIIRLYDYLMIWKKWLLLCQMHIFSLQVFLWPVIH